MRSDISDKNEHFAFFFFSRWNKQIVATTSNSNILATYNNEKYVETHLYQFRYKSQLGIVLFCRAIITNLHKACW